MKKTLKILFITILVIFAALIITPMLFKGKIMKIAKNQINQNINARVEFSDLGISLLKNFPYLNLSLKDLTVVGIGAFETDTLIAFRSFDVAVDLISAIKMEHIKVKEIILVRPQLNAHVLVDGTVNWDIMKPSEEETIETDTTISEISTQIVLKKFEIQHADISYLDDSLNITAALNDFNFMLSGNFAEDFSSLSVNSTSASVNVSMEGIQYVKHATMNFMAIVDANLKDNIYILKDNELSLNNMALQFEGSVSLPNEEDIDVDLKFNTKKTDFKSLLSLIPAIYMKGYEDLETRGNFAVNGNIRGTYNEKFMPSASLKLEVQDAMFKYPDLPKSAEKISVDLSMYFDGVQNDNSTIDVNKFHVELAGNPFDMTLNIKTPVSDPYINASLNTNLNLASIRDVILLEDMTLNGEIISNLDAMGYLSYIENEQYEMFKADGNIKIKNLVIEGAAVPQKVTIQTAEAVFSPKYVQIENLNMTIGQSDMQFSGRVENFIPYVFSDGTIRGDFIFTSGYLNLNEFMTETEELPEAEGDTVPLTVFEIPDNIDFKLTSRLDEILYDKINIKNTVGIIYVRENKMILERLKMEMLGGNIALNGEYNTKDIKAPFVNFAIQANEIGIPQTVSSLSTLEKLVPIAKKANGNISLGLDYFSFLGEDMSPVLKSISANGNLKSGSIGINDASTFQKIGDVIKTDKFNNMTLNDVAIKFEVKNGKIFVDPFKTKMGDTEFLIGGDQGLDQTLNYSINISLPKSMLGKNSLDVASSKASLAGFKLDQSTFLNYDIKVTGTFKDPKISWDLKNTLKQSKEAIQNEIKAEAKEIIDQKKEAAKAVVNEEAERIIAEAEREAEQVREKAQQAADAVRKEANTNAEKLVKDAKGPVAKLAAEPAAKKLKEEGENNARNIEREADDKANKIIEEARKKADKLKGI
ncbi:MAG: hypothetical protein JXJ22_00170 [Bacteroidales bacterium]|nr:hypothetical protein [Bacteroidales bacterium]